MRQDALLPRSGVVPDERDGVVTAVDAFHHRPRLVRADQHARSGVDAVQQQIPLVRMGFVDQDLGRTRVEEALDSGVDVAVEELAVVLPPRVVGLDVVRKGHAGDAFHVGRDQHAHTGHPSVTVAARTSGTGSSK